MLGDGVRLSDHAGGTIIKLERISLTHTPQAMNLWLRVARSKVVTRRTDALLRAEPAEICPSVRVASDVVIRLFPPSLLVAVGRSPLTWAFASRVRVLGGGVPPGFPRPFRLHFPWSEACGNPWGNRPPSGPTTKDLLRGYFEARWSWGESNRPARSGIIPAQWPSPLVRVRFRMACSDRE